MHTHTAHEHMHAMQTHTCRNLYTCRNLSSLIQGYALINTCMHKSGDIADVEQLDYTHTCTHMYMYMYVCVCIYIYILEVYIYTHTGIYTYIHTQKGWIHTASL